MNSFPQEGVTSLNYTDYLEAHGKSETQIHIGAQECMRGLKVNSHGPETRYFNEHGEQIQRDDFEIKYAKWARGFLMTTNVNNEGYIIKACTLGESNRLLRRVRGIITSLVGPS